MTYFTKQFSAELILPDGTVASSAKDIDRYLKAGNLAANSDYSAAYIKNIQRNRELNWQKDIFAELLQQYKKRIWND